MPWDFWRLTPLEWTWVWKGHQRRGQRRWWQLAVVATWHITPWSKRPPKAEQLLGWQQPFRED